jgi:DNA-binding SARP family transcriptional activator/Tol biopolymer transport system component
MFRLQLLGGASLTGPLGPVSGRVGHRHRLALMALLAGAGEKGCSRDKLVAYLWPESDATHARHRLSDSLYLLRRALGEDSVVVAGEDMWLNREAVAVDVVAFQEALERGDPETAATLYGGPFLDGFHLGSSRAFEEWLESERSRLADLHAKALESLAVEAERSGDPARASVWWKQLLAADPLSSRAALSLMKALAAAGDPANAIRQAQVHERLLRDELDMEAPSEIQALVERLRDEQPPSGSASGGRVAKVEPEARPVPASESPGKAATLTTPRVMTGFVRGRDRRYLLAVGVVAIAAVATLTGLRLLGVVPDRRASRSVVEFYLDPPEATMTFGSRILLSPDGRRLVAEIDDADDGWFLYQRMLDSRSWRVIPGTEEAYAPFFSPDGRWLGFVSGPEEIIKRIPVDGGSARTIVRVGRPIEGVSWGPDNTVVYSTVESASGNKWTSLFRVKVDGGVPERLTTLDTTLKEVAHRDPCDPPGGEVVLFTTVNSLLEPEVAAVSLQSGKMSRLARGMTPLSDRAGRVLYVTPTGSAVAQTFDPGTLALEGSPRSIAEGIAIAGGITASYTVSRDGSLAYLSESHEGDRLLLVSRRGETRPLFSPGVGSRVAEPRFSPSGDRIAFVLDGNVWVYSVAEATAQRLSFEGPAADPAWTSDGRSIGYSIVEAGTSVASLYLRAADGTGSAEKILAGNRDYYQVDFAPGDGEVVFFSTSGLFRAPLGGGSGPVALLQTDAFVEHPALSPDGRWLAYKSNESGCDEVYVRSYPDMGPPTLVSAGACGRSPAWSGDGRAIFYRGPDGLVEASVRPESSRIAVVGRDDLFSVEGFQWHWNRDYDVHRDGQEFVMVSRPKSRAVVKVNALAGRR